MRRRWNRWAFAAVVLVWGVSSLMQPGASLLDASPRLQWGAVEAGIAQELEQKGIQVPTVGVRGKMVVVGYYQPPVEAPEEIAVNWVRVFDVVARKASNLSQVRLQISFKAAPRATVQAYMRDIQAFRKEQTTAAEFLAALNTYASPQEPSGFGMVTFSSGFDENAYEPVNAGRNFPQALPIVYAFWSFDGVRPGALAQYAWYCSGERCGGGEFVLERSSGQSKLSLRNADGSPLERGNYRVVIQVDGRTLHDDECLIEGPAPPAAPPSPEPAAAPVGDTAGGQAYPAAGLIAFASDAGGDYEIYLAAPDGTDLSRLTATAGDDRFPMWSPDGSRLLYWCGRAGIGQICVMNADGSSQRQLTSHPAEFEVGAPVWSTDGTRIAYACGSGETAQICTMSADGANQRQLTDFDTPPGVGLPAWSPDGRWIAFHVLARESFVRDVYILEPATGALSKLGSGGFPSWSPDGTRLALTRGPEPDGPIQVYVNHLDGSGLHKLSENTGWGMYPTWSPDSSQIAYIVRGQGLFLMNADGTNHRQLSAHDTYDVVWSPDGTQLVVSQQDQPLTVIDATGSVVQTLPQGVSPSWSPAAVAPPQAAPVTEQIPAEPVAVAPSPTVPSAPQPPATAGRIAFSSDFQGDYDIYAMEPDGSNPVRLTNTPGEDWFPAWSPDGTQVAYQCSRGGSFELCVMNSDGTNGRQLTGYDETGSVQRATWSPDGQWIAFSLESTQAPTAIYAVPSTGGSALKVTEGRDPSWSPDGSRIAYTEMTGLGLAVAVVNTDGSNPLRLTGDEGFNKYPTWSPDGSQIAYVVDGQGLFVMNADGSGRRQISDHASWGLAWSPDGTRLALGDQGSLMVVGLDGSLIASLQQGIQPSWSR